MRKLLGLACLSFVVVACGGGEDAGSSESVGGSRGVTQGGAQDIAEFRRIVAAGEVPSPETLDPVGFFAEHALDLPEADCGEDICMHPMLAVAPRFDGTNWTMAFVAMNSPVDPASLERPPLHLVVAIERSEHTEPSYRAAELGLRVMASKLREGDRLSLVAFDRRTGTVLEAATPDSETVDDALLAARELDLGDGVALYDALAVAGRLATTPVDGFDGTSRVLLLTSGHADAGITDPNRVVGLADALARQGVALNVIGTGGDAFDSRIPQRLGELGAGTYSVAEDSSDLDRILRFEGDTTMFPLATDFRLQIEASTGYRVGRVYGARRAWASEERAALSSPALFLGHRTGSDDVGAGRRGGGGGLFVELIAEPDATTGVGAGQPAFTMSAEWTAADGTPRAANQSLVNGLAPGQNPDGMWPELSDEAHGNAFMMLNMYLTLRSATEFHDAGDCARALGVIDMVAPTVELWQAEYDNPDIWEDFELLMDLRANIAASCSQEPVEPRLFNAGCMAS